MARASVLVVLVVVSVLLYTSRVAEPAAANSGSTSFIKAKCSATRYPALCVQSLSVYASTIQKSPKQLAHTALTVSLAKAQSAKAFVSKLGKIKGMKARELEAVQDCLEEMNDSIDRLSRSVQELEEAGKSKGQDFLWHMSNVDTWVSAALTDDNTCVDGFAGRALDGRVKASIRGWLVTVAQVTSNALALVNQFAAKN
ncbi:21 kDa protein [Vitis vinifera]|uniref:21 kDa protein n=1 Tax=Vitis vinifera TaxID=29760 RepID=A0A438DXE6_VITVI|nr:21 kDa protein [Vitis vinifera]